MLIALVSPAFPPGCGAFTPWHRPKYPEILPRSWLRRLLAAKQQRGEPGAVFRRQLPQFGGERVEVAGVLSFPFAGASNGASVR